MKDLNKNFWQLFKLTLPFLILLLISCIFFWRVILFREVPIPADFVLGTYLPWLDYKWGFPAGVPVKNPIMADVVSFSYPMRMLAVDLIKSGKLPLWNPYILAGTPLLANFQSAPLAPTIIYYFFFDKLTGWSLQIISQHVLASIFTYLLLRSWKMSKTASIFGGVIFAFSGFNVIWSEWNAHGLVAAFIPLIILCSDKILTLKKYDYKYVLYGFLLSLAICFQILSGYPQLIFYSFFVILLIWLVREKSIKNTVILGIYSMLGFGLASLQILPGAELLTLSQRTSEAHPFEWSFLPWKKIITFISSDYFGNHVTGNYWGPQDYTSNTGYVGVFAFSLALLPLLFNKSKEIWFAILLCILSLLLSFPTPLSIMFWESGAFGFQAASAHRALVLFNLSIAILASYGLSKIEENRGKFLLLIPFGILSVYFISSWQDPHRIVAMRNLILPFGFLLILFILLSLRKIVPKSVIHLGIVSFTLLELFLFGWKFLPFSNRSLVFPATPVIDFLQDKPKPFRTTGDHVIPINLRMNYNIETIEGYDAVYPASISKFINQVNGGNDSSELRRYAIVDNDTSSLLDLVNVKYYIADTTQKNLSRFDGNRFKPVFKDGRVLIYESRLATPRAYFERSKIEPVFSEYSELSSTLLFTIPDSDKLIISDTWYPGWKVYIDGVEGEIEKTKYGFRQVAINKGKHTVEFKYIPESFAHGIKFSFLSLAALSVFSVSVIIFGKWKSVKIE